MPVIWFYKLIYFKYCPRIRFTWFILNVKFCHPLFSNILLGISLTTGVFQGNFVVLNRSLQICCLWEGCLTKKLAILQKHLGAAVSKPDFRAEPLQTEFSRARLIIGIRSRSQLIQCKRSFETPCNFCSQKLSLFTLRHSNTM